MSRDGEQQAGFTAPSEHPSSLLALLKRRYFRRMWAITTVSSLGDWFGVFALTFYVGQISGRAEFAVGGVLLFRVVPGLFFGPFAGVLAERFDRRRLMGTAAGSSASTSIERTRSSRSTAARRSSSRASCRSFAHSRPSWQASAR